MLESFEYKIDKLELEIIKFLIDFYKHYFLVKYQIEAII